MTESTRPMNVKEIMRSLRQTRKRSAQSVACTARRAGEAGFTLIELLVVMVILVLLASLVAPRVIGYLGSSRTKSAKVQIESLSTSLELYKLDTGRYPDGREGLNALVQRARRFAELERPVSEEGQGAARSVGAALHLPLPRAAWTIRYPDAWRRQKRGRTR